MKIKRKIFNIFVAIVMVIGSVPMTFFNAYAEEPAGDAPKSLKTVKSNNDGTYDITLEIEGVSSNKTDATKANVVVVFDSSGSMNTAATTYNYSANTSGRYWLSNGDYLNLYRYSSRYGCYRMDSDNSTTNVYTDSGCQNKYTGTRYTRTAVNGTRLSVAKTAVNGLANQLLSQNDPSNPAFTDVVEMAFVDFGRTVKSTTTHTTSTTSLDTFKDWVSKPTADGGTNWEDALTTAKNVSFGTGDTDKTYIIFVSDGNPTYRNSKYANNANDCKVSSGGVCTLYGTGNSDPNGWNLGAAKAVASTIIADTNMELYAVGTFGEADNMKSLGGTYYDATDQVALETAFADIVDKITMGLSVADLQVTDGITAATSAEIKGTAGHFRYSVPESWGTDYAAATFENGAVHWNPGHDKTLTNGEKASVTFTVWPSQAAMDCIAAIRNDGACAIADEDLAAYGLGKNADGSYRLITNSTATFKYRTATKIEGSTETTYSALSDDVDFDEQRDPTNLPETTLNVVKKWLDAMDPGQREDISEIAVDMYVDRTDGSDPVRHYTFSKDSQQGNEWAGKDQNGKSTYTVAPGVMKKLDGTAATEGLRSLGRVVTVGSDEYVVLEEGHDYEFDNEAYSLNAGGSNHYHLTKWTYHPMIIGEGGSIHDVVFSEDGKTATIEDGVLTKLSLENTLNGGILVGKKVINNGKEDTTITDEYEITVQMTGSNSGKYRIYTYNPDGSVVSRTDKKDYTGGKIVEKIKVNQKIMVTDVPTGTTFTVTEALPAGYTSNSVSYEVIMYDGTDNQQGVNEVFGNASSTATVTNVLESGDIVISKEVTASSGNLTQAQGQTFDVTVNFYKKQGDAQPVRTETLTIKHGETKTIKNIPAGWYYEVVESAKAGFNSGVATTKTGTVKQGDNKVDFKNDYAVSKLNDNDAKIMASKAFAAGYEQFWLSSDKFTFVLTGNGETKESTPVTLSADTAEFVVTIADEGTYTYTITEKTQDAEGNSLFRSGVSRLENDTDIVVTIVTKDNGDGTLSLVSKTYSKESKTIFNKYEATGTLGEGETKGALKFNKVLEGRDWESFDEYTFTIESEDGPLPKTTTLTAKKGQTEFDFGTIKYTNKDVGKTYNYVVRETFDATKMKNVEQSSETAGGISITVKVTDNEDGTLNLEVSEYSHTFKNIYTPDEVTTGDSELTDTLFTVYKTVTDEKQRFNGEEFVFEISGEGFETKTVEITTATSDSQAMDGVYTFTKPGNYTFTVVEKAGTNKEMSYDNKSYTVEIEVVDNPSAGKLEIKSAKVNGKAVTADTKLQFTNLFDPDMYHGTGELTVTKKWNGGLNWQNDVTVLLTAKANGKQLWQKPGTITSLNNWTVTFTGLYTYENGVEIEYSVEETGIVGADATTYIVYGEETTADGAKKVEGQWTKSVNEFEITNTWTESSNDYIYEGATEFEIAKVDENGKELAGVKFDVNGKSYTTDKNGKATVEVPVKANATEDNLTFTVKETESVEGYDKAEGEANITVTCAVALTGVDADNLTNTYTKTCRFGESGNSAYSWDSKELKLTVVNNRSLADSLTIRKEISGVTGQALRDNGLQFTVTGPSDFAEQTIGFDKFTKISDGVYEYKLTGRVPTGKYKVVESNAELKDLLKLTTSGENNVEKTVSSGDVAKFTIKNSYEKIRDVSYSVAKTWMDDDDRDGKRPDELEITLLRNNETYKTVKLSDEAGWSYTWTELPRAGEDAKVYSYSAVEADVDYYVSDGGKMKDGVMTFTNVHEPELINEDDEDPNNDGKLKVTKLWDDEDNLGNTRPLSITVRLLANGEELEVANIIAGNDGTWEHVFSGLYKYDGGEEIEYTISEVKVDNYNILYEQDGYDFIISNIISDPCLIGGCGGDVVPETPETGVITSEKASVAAYSSMIGWAALMSLGAIMLGARRKAKSYKESEN